MKFTFKTTKSTGKYRSFELPTHDIKIKKQVVGSISAEDFSIYLRVIKSDILEDGNANCPWKWIKLKKESNSLNEAKEFLNNNFKAITEKWKLATV